MGKTKIALVGYLAVVTIAVFAYGSALAAGIRVVPSTQRAIPGDNFFVDVVAEGIPTEGLGGVQFRLNVAVPGGTVTGMVDLGQAGAGEVAVASPLLVSQPTLTRSGIGDFFRGAAGPNGILVMDNESLVNGSALYTFSHTNGSTPPAGSGSVARFMVRVAPGVNAKQININLTDVMLLDGGPVYPLDHNTGATVQIGCFTRMPELIGLSLNEAVNRLAQAQLVLGSSYEIDNTGGIRPLNVVLEQSAPAGSELLCEAPVNLAVNVPPLEVAQAAAIDKLGDDAGVVLVSWSPSLSGDVSGYRVYRGANLLKDVGNPAATGSEVGGLPNGVVAQLKVTAYDTFGNESQGVSISATPLDDVPPAVIIAGVTDGAYYRSDVTPQVSVSDTNPADTTITLNGNPYLPAPITADGAFTLTVTGVDSSENRTTKSARFTVDKTPPAITVINMANGASYNSALTPAISITDANLEGSSISLNGQPYVPGTPVNAAGSYELLVSAEDLAGNSASLTVAFVIDTVPPAMSVSTLSDGAYTNNQTLNVAGAVQDAVALRDLQINGSSVPVGADGSFSYALVLQSGVNTIIVTATDNAGNRATDTRTVTLDQTAPSLVITTPADNAKTGTALLAVSGNVDETSIVTVKLGDSALPAVQTGNIFTAALTLVPGYNTIETTATDLAGNKSTLKRTVVFDDQKPSLAVTEPNQDIRANQASLTIKGTVFDALTAVNVSIDVDGQTFTPPVVNGAYEQTLTFTAEKSYAIAVTATNEVGSVSTVQRNVFYDITPPTLAIDAVTTPTNQNSQTINGAKETGATIAVTCAPATVGSVTYPTDTTWSAMMSGFTTGANDVSVAATDAAGNVTAATARIIYDATAPSGSVTINSGAAVTNSAQVQLTLSATDVNGVAQMQISNDGTAWSAPESYAVTKMWTLASGDGFKQVYVKYGDSAENWSNAASAGITLDTAPPMTTASPAGGIYNASQSVTLTTSEEAVIYYSTDGTTPTTGSLIYSQANSISATTTLKYFARDFAGNQSDVKAETYIIDTQQPVLSVSSLSDGAYTNSSVINIAGTMTDNTGVQGVTVNGTAVAVNSDGSFSYALFLKNGINNVTTIAADLAGNQATDNRTITLDQTAPVLTITAPADNSKTGMALLAVTGNVDESSTVLVKLGGNIQTASMNGNGYTATVNLAPGSNTIEITATDQAGNQSSQKRTVLYDDQKPSVAITDPSQDIRTNMNSLIVKGTASDPLTSVIVTITMDSQTYSPPVVNGAFEQAVTFTDQKNYSIVATATNEVESATSAQRNVIYDSTPPALTINPVTSPTSQSSQVISGIREMDVPVAVSCATATVGELFYPTATTWTVGISNLQFGNNTIIVTATDTAGNTGAPVSAAIMVSTNNSVSAAGPAKLWIGLKNSDDQGTQFDLRSELYINGVLISEGATLCITGVTRNTPLAKEIAVPFNPVTNGSYASGDVLFLKVLTRIGTTATGQKCPGPGGSHSSAVGLRLYYDAPDRPSSFSAAIAPDPMKEYYLHATNGSQVADAVAPTGTLKYLDSSGINYNNGNPWKEIGIWTKVLQ